MRRAFMCGGGVGLLIGAVLWLHAITPPPAAGGWPKVIRDLMHRSCISGATQGAAHGTPEQERACRCLVRRVEAQYTLAEFVAIAEATDGEMPSSFERLILDCAIETTTQK